MCTWYHWQCSLDITFDGNILNLQKCSRNVQITSIPITISSHRYHTRQFWLLKLLRFPMVRSFPPWLTISKHEFNKQFLELLNSMSGSSCKLKRQQFCCLHKLEINFSWTSIDPAVFCKMHSVLLPWELQSNSVLPTNYKTYKVNPAIPGLGTVDSSDFSSGSNNVIHNKRILSCSELK